MANTYCRTCLKNGPTQDVRRFLGLLTDRPEYCALPTCAACAKAGAKSDEKLLAGFREIFSVSPKGKFTTRYVRDETSLRMQAAAKALLVAGS